MPAPTPDSAYLSQAQTLWARFTKAAFAAVALSVAVLGFMAIVLL